MPCGRLADDYIADNIMTTPASTADPTGASVPTEPSSPVNSMTTQSSGLLDAFPPLKERMASSIIVPLLKKGKGRAGLLQGDPAVGSVGWDQAMRSYEGSASVGHAGEGPASEGPAFAAEKTTVYQMGGVQSNTGAGDDGYDVVHNAPFPRRSLAPNRMSGGDEPGPLTSISSTDNGSFDVDVFINGFINQNEPPTPLALPSSAARSMRNQTEKSFTTKTGGDKTKSKSKGTGGILDGTPKGFLENDVMEYSHLGLNIPCTSDTAAKYREKMTENEMKWVTYACAQERAGANWRKTVGGQVEQLAKITAEVQRSAQHPNINFASYPEFTSVHTAVALNRKTLDGLLDVLPSNEFYEALQENRDDTDDLLDQARETKVSLEATRAELAALRGLIETNFHAATSVMNMAPTGAAVSHGMMSATPSAMTTTAQNMPTATNFMNAAPAGIQSSNGMMTTSNFAGAAGQNFPGANNSSNGFHTGAANGTAMAGQIPMNAPISAAVSAAFPAAAAGNDGNKRSATAKYGPRKRQRTDNGSYADVIYRPVVKGNSSFDDLTAAALGLVARMATFRGEKIDLAVEDVWSTKPRGNMLSIRFKTQEKASIFAALVNRAPPLEGQTASFRNGAPNVPIASGSGTTQEMMDVLRGAGGQTR
ncbi:hypothetical protein C8R46DRAFT_562254 [Mycena filopes]|nr:hypothetical protein C8R46DRAFT_562254 [Mycena filopes]